jgi:hypothetical protein
MVLSLHVSGKVSNAASDQQPDQLAQGREHDGLDVALALLLGFIVAGLPILDGLESPLAFGKLDLDFHLARTDFPQLSKDSGGLTHGRTSFSGRPLVQDLRGPALNGLNAVGWDHILLVAPVTIHRQALISVMVILDASDPPNKRAPADPLKVVVPAALPPMRTRNVVADVVPAVM